MLHRIGSVVVTCQYRRFIGVQFELLFMGNFLFGTVESGDRGSIVVTAQPFIVRAELALPQIRLLIDGLHRASQRLHVNAIDSAVIWVGLSLSTCHLLSHGRSPCQCLLTRCVAWAGDSVPAT